MQLKIRFTIFLLISGAIFSDSIKFNSINKNGLVGLINTPTARFYDASSASFNISYGDPDSKITLNLAPYDWLEGSIYYTSIKGRPYGSGLKQNYKDKGLNLKIRLKEEGDWPALAIGLNDIGGTGIYSSEFIVGSYGIGGLDMHLGLGWGILSGGRFSQSNFLEIIDNSFSKRDSGIGQGGTLNSKNFFSGKNLGIFGGFSSLIARDFLFMYEYDSSDFSNKLGFKEYPSHHSIGIEYIAHDNFTAAISFERGDYFGLKFSWKGNSSAYTSKPYRNNNPYEDTPYGRLRSLLDFNEIEVQKISKSENTLILNVKEFNSYSNLDDIKHNMKKAITDSGIDSEEVIVSYEIKGLRANEYKIETFGNFDTTNTKTLYEREKKSKFYYSPDLVLRPFIAGREDFIKVALMAELNAQYIFKEKLFWSTNLKYALWQNFDDLYIPPVNTYPNQVRSDIKDYLNNFENRLILGRAQLDFFHTLSDNNHLQFSAGIFEEMFSGYGMEYLWNRNDLPFAIGFEAFKVYKRDYDLAFDLLDYSNTTGHVNFYYENDYDNFLIPFSLHLSYGEYLAGDKGYTFDISRRFDNGVVMGAFFTKTDVTAEQFGEGSFDKGIYFKIPISGDWFNFKWRPLTKDPGAKLIRKDNLYHYLRNYKD